jgi:hypothetical protein
MNKALALLFGFAAALHTTLATAQPSAGGGVVRGTIVNGTTGEPGQAETVTLYNLSEAMEAVALVENVSGSFRLEGFDVQGQTPYLLQATIDGVDYSQTINFGGSYEAEATLTVYDATREWKDIEIKTARFLLRREHDKLRIDKLYVIDNKTDPQKTLYDPEGSVRFYVPDGVALGSVSASSASGMPVPQSASPLSDGSGYATPTALKPGTTDLAISYEVDYGREGYRLHESAFHPLSELMVLVAPADIEVEAEGWEGLGPDPQGRFTVFRRNGVEAGSPIDMALSGGSEHAADLTNSSEGERSSGNRVTTLPDPTRPQKWIIVALMGAALAYGLLTALTSTKEAQPAKDPNLDGLRRSLADLEQRHGAGSISTKSYRKKKRELQSQLAQLDRAAGRQKP